MIGGSEQREIDRDNRTRTRHSAPGITSDDFTSIYLTQVAVNGGDFSAAGEATGEAFLLFAALVVVGFTAYFTGSVVLNTLTRNPFCGSEKFLRKRGVIPLQLTDNPGVYNGVNLLYFNRNYKLNCLSGSVLKSKSTSSLTRRRRRFRTWSSWIRYCRLGTWRSRSRWFRSRGSRSWRFRW